MANLTLSRGRGSDPLGWLTANTADHIGMGECFRGPLSGLDVQRRSHGLSDAGVQRRRAAGDDQRIFPLAASRRPVPGGRTDEGRMVSQRRSHFDG